MQNFDWIVAVCDDLHAYAVRNDLPAVADAVKNAMNVAIWEIASLDAGQENETDFAISSLQTAAEPSATEATVIKFPSSRIG
ncbi:hypothetical protein [uncultured Tateyamaria sp.]|uniref:hypothetical protein n=1 Tax=uncultured Tateyamaria sp. TaxID=455651 RepID=UPI00261166BB|nr:hypothetical protein [uncultured Tateyamaria sp.]